MPNYGDMWFDPTRFWEKVEPGVSDDECWNWTGATMAGYGVLSYKFAYPYFLKAHRVAYELEHGPIPEGMQLHHTCVNRSCVNPKHLELVTHDEHLRIEPRLKKSTHCQRGHRFVHRYGRHYCPTCASERYHARAAA